MKIKRGEIYLVDLGEAFGSEQGGVRPVLVIQNNTGNAHSHTVIVACISSKIESNEYKATHYYLDKSVGLKETSIVMLEQLRTIDINRIHFKVGKVKEYQMRQIEKKIILSLNLSNPVKKYGKKSNEFPLVGKVYIKH